MQNGLVGGGDAADAAHAANGSWAETKQSDADPHCGCGLRRGLRVYGPDGELSKRRDECVPERFWQRAFSVQTH